MSCYGWRVWCPYLKSDMDSSSLLHCHQVLGNNWVYQLEEHINSMIACYKARLVAKISNSDQVWTFLMPIVPSSNGICLPYPIDYNNLGLACTSTRHLYCNHVYHVYQNILYRATNRLY